MCRFVAYTGPATLMENLLFKADNSLVTQSKFAKMRVNPVNGDGFGVGWFPEHDVEPGTYVSIEPAWSNRNLLQVAAKIRTKHFFGHIRDASVGMPVSQSNCHPFQFGRFLWMHNGRLDKFDSIRRAIINQLSDRAFNYIKGNTDSEYAFAMFLDQINFDSQASTATMKAALYETINKIMALRVAADAQTNAFINFAVTNGQSMLFTRFCTKEGVRPASLFYCVDHSGNESSKTITVASEPLSVDKVNWHKVERNHLVQIDDTGTLSVEAIPLSFQN